MPLTAACHAASIISPAQPHVRAPFPAPTFKMKWIQLSLA